MLFNDTRHTPSWDEPIEMLYACHGKVKRFCHDLSLLPDYLAQNGVNPAAREAIGRILIYFNQAAPLHHQDEEDDFFPALLQYAPQAQADIDELTRQHVALHQNWADLRSQLESLLANDTGSLKRETVAAFNHAYAAHIAIEEPLFDLGRQVIPTQQQQAIGKIMADRRRS